jgi:hypothetical protein
MGRYFAYRLSIESELPLPEMEPDGDGTAPADVVIRFGAVDRGMPGSAVAGICEGATAREVVLQYPGSGAFLIREGREIVIERDAGADDASVRVLLTGPVLAVLLHQRGYLILHASCVARGECAIAFAADSGTGKSTLAAAFTARGYGLVADDIVAIDTDAPGGPRIFPGFFQMKLSAESARSIGVEWEKLADLGVEKNKRGHRSRGTLMQASLPLRRIYLPTDDSCESIDRLTPQDSFGQVIHHSYALPILSQTRTQRAHFRQAAKLASAVPVRKLRRRRSLELLPEVVTMVEKELGEDRR